MTNDPRRGISLMVVTMAMFAVQDGISRHLAEQTNVITVVMLRYWFFAAFVVAFSALRGGGVRQVARSGQPALQILRGVLLVAEICVAVLAFVLLGLIEAHAIFAIYPLLVAALSGPVLGEPVGWRRWCAIGVGMIGMLVILRPGLRVFSPEALVALLAALMFTFYALLTRKVSRLDTAATSFFWTGVAGAVAITAIGPFFWEPMQTTADWIWMGALCVSGAAGHFLLIKAYEAAEASVVQPFSYLQLVFVSLIALTLFGEVPDRWTVAGAALIIGAGLYTLFREARLSRSR